MVKKRNTRFTGKFHEHHPVLDSTNAYAAQCLAGGRPPEGTVITTYAQKAGRGQRGSRWLSEPGKNMALSLILYPDFLPVERSFLLNMGAALAVRDLVRSLLAHPVWVKWPNDILVRNQKIAGILLQNTLGQKGIASSIWGIGLNVNQEAFPAELSRATSLYRLTGRTFSLPELVDELCYQLEQRYLQLQRSEYEQLVDEYHRGLYGWGEWLPFAFPDGTPFTARIQGVDAHGRLRLQPANGPEELFQPKDVSLALPHQADLP